MENKHNFEFCPKCNYKTLSIKTDGFHNGKHYQIKFGKWCKRCRIIYVDKSIKINEVKFEQLTLEFGWGYSSKVSRAKKAHYFPNKNAMVSICGKEKIFNDMKMKFVNEDGLFNNQKCSICENLIKLHSVNKTIIEPSFSLEE